LYGFRLKNLSKIDAPSNLASESSQLTLLEATLFGGSRTSSLKTSSIQLIQTCQKLSARYMKKDPETLKNLLNDFLVLIDNRTTTFLVINEKLLLKILEWDVSVWKNNWQNLQEKAYSQTHWFELSNTLESTILKIAERGIKERQYFFTVFFLKNFQKHLEAHKEDSIRIGTKTLLYREDLFGILFKLLIEFEKTDSLNEKEFIARATCYEDARTQVYQQHFIIYATCEL
jgi:hypothetical protein